MKAEFKRTGRTEHHCPKCHELQGGVKISDRYYYHRTYGEGYQEKFFKCKFCGYIWGRTFWDLLPDGDIDLIQIRSMPEFLKVMPK